MDCPYDTGGRFVKNPVQPGLSAAGLGGIVSAVPLRELEVSAATASCVRHSLPCLDRRGRRQDQYQCSHSPLMEATPKAQNHILGLQKRGEGTDIDSKIPLDEICLSALSGRTAAGQPPLEFRHRELGRISTSQWSAWNIILGQFAAYIHLQEKVGTMRTVRSEQNQVSNTTAEQVHDEGCDRCRRWYRWWVGQSRTPIRVAVTSSDAEHDVKCKRTMEFGSKWIGRKSVDRTLGEEGACHRLVEVTLWPSSVHARVQRIEHPFGDQAPPMRLFTLKERKLPVTKNRFLFANFFRGSKLHSLPKGETNVLPWLPEAMNKISNLNLNLLL